MGEAPQMDAIFIIVVMCISGVFGGILNVLQDIDIRKLVQEGDRAISSVPRFVAGLVLGGFRGSGGAIAMLFLLAVADKLPTTATSKNIVILFSLGVVSGFIGYRLLRRVAASVEKQIEEAVGRTEKKIEEVEDRVDKDVRLADALRWGEITAEREVVLPSDLRAPIEDLEEVRREMPSESQVGIMLGRLYVEKSDDVRKGIRVLSEVLEAKKKEGADKDEYAADLLYNRACYFNLIANKASGPEKNELKEKAYEDLEASIRLAPENKDDALVDPVLESLRHEERFGILISSSFSAPSSSPSS